MSASNKENTDQEVTKKEINKHGKNLENIINNGVDREEIAQAQEATEFLKKQETINNKDKIEATIEAYKANIKTNIITYFNTEITTPVLLNHANVIQNTKIIDTINDINVIEAYLNIIAWINDPNNEDLNTIKTQLTNKREGLEQQQNQKKTEEADQKAIDILSSTVEPKVLFETGPRENFDAVMKYICKNDAKKEITTTATDAYEKKLFDLVNTYTAPKVVTKITIGKAEKQGFGQKFFEGTRLIQYITTTNTNTNTDNFIARGTNEHLEDLKAQQAEANGDFDKNVFEAGQTGIAYFNTDRGYFQGLKRYLYKKGEAYTKQYLGKIIEGIKTYKIEDTDKDNESFIKNGFADMLTQYVINNPNLMTTYISYMRPENINMLGIDKTTRIKNFNFIVESTTFKAIKKTDDQNKLIIELRSSIEPKKQGNTIDTLGKMLVSLMSMLGIGKRGLKNIFPKNFWEKIDKIYAEEFALEKEEKEAITDITENLDTTDGEWRTAGIEKSYQSPSAKALQKHFENKEAKKKFLENISKLDGEKIGFLDPAIIQKGILFYNKSNPNTPISQEKFIDPKSRKVKVENKDKETFTEIITAIVDNEATRETIAKANNNIWETVKDKNGKAVPSEYFNNPEEKKNYIIKNAQDTGRYLASYFFAGSKDISYIMTENKIDNTNTTPAST